MKVIAHRGASGEFPENSLLALEQAIIQGSDGIEFDVQYHHASGEFILLHDKYLKHNGQRKHFNDLTLAELLSKNPQQDLNVCTLTAALNTIAKRCVINIELKSASQGRHLVREVEQLKQQIQPLLANQTIINEQLIISSFNHHALIPIAEHLPELRTAALIACCPLNYAEFCQPLKATQLNLATDCLNQEIIEDAHRRGLEVWVYTVDNTAEIKQCLTYGVDGIFTNFPKRTRELISAIA